MKTQLLLTFGVILCSLTASLALRSETVTKKTNSTVVDNTAKQEIQKFYCTIVKFYDEILTVRKLTLTSCVHACLSVCTQLYMMLCSSTSISSLLYSHVLRT